MQLVIHMWPDIDDHITMRAVLLCLTLACLGYDGTLASADIHEVIEKPRITMAGFDNVPQCEYESCYSSDQCGSVPARMNPNFTHRTDAKSPCSCDSSCLLYGDCCFDYFQTCLGANISDIVANNTLNVNILVEHFGSETAVLRQQQMLKMKACLPVNTGNQESYYWLVSRCPLSSGKDAISCEMKDSLINHIPVTMIENPTIMFMNYHCAECHGLQRRHVHFWNTTATCRHVNISTLSFGNVQEYVNQGRCSLSLHLNSEDNPRSCIPDQHGISKIHPTLPPLPQSKYAFSNAPEGTLLDKLSRPLCSLYVYTVKDPEDWVYRNPHCAYVDKGPAIEHTPLRCNWKLGYIVTPYPIGYTPFPAATPYNGPTPHALSTQSSHNAPTSLPGGSVNSFNMLFNFGENEMSLEINGRVVRTETRLCLREDEVFNIYSHKCVTLLCDGMDMHPVNGTCILKDNQVMDGARQLYPHGAHNFTIALSVRGKDTLMRKFVKKKMKHYFERFLSDRIDISHKMSVNITIPMKRVHAGVAMNNVTRVTKLATYTYTANVESNAPVSSLINATGCLFRQLSIQLSHHNVKAFDFSLNNYEGNYAYASLDVSEFDEDGDNSTEVCPEEHAPKMFQDVELISVRDYYYARLNRTYFRLDNIGFEMHYEDREAVPSLVDIIVCVPDLGNESLHCPKGKLSIHQSEFSLVNDSLRYIPSRVMLSPGNFSLTRHGAIICSHFSRSHADQVVFFDYSNVQVVLTIATSSVSMACLVVVLLVYSFLPQLRNVPGKIVMSLSATLLVAQGLQLMTKVPTGQMCVAVASLVHMMWLSTFLWMSLLSVDLARSLRSMSPLSGTQGNNKLLCLYACIGWGIPFLLVVICVVMDRFHVWGIIIGYGSDHMCWIANPKASLYVFGLPLALTLLINVTCFILTLISIERTASKVASHSKSCKNEKKRLGIYVRLSFIMGFSWVFCFIAAFAHVSLLWYFQIVLNGLQGFYIFVCFVCKSRTFKLLKDKLCSLSKKAQARGITSTTTTSTSS